MQDIHFQGEYFRCFIQIIRNQLLPKALSYTQRRYIQTERFVKPGRILCTRSLLTPFPKKRNQLLLFLSRNSTAFFSYIELSRMFWWQSRMELLTTSRAQKIDFFLSFPSFFAEFLYFSLFFRVFQFHSTVWPFKPGLIIEVPRERIFSDSFLPTKRKTHTQKKRS